VQTDLAVFTSPNGLESGPSPLEKFRWSAMAGPLATFTSPMIGTNYHIFFTSLLKHFGKPEHLALREVRAVGWQVNPGGI